MNGCSFYCGGYGSAWILFQRCFPFLRKVPVSLKPISVEQNGYYTLTLRPGRQAGFIQDKANIYFSEEKITIS